LNAKPLPASPVDEILSALADPARRRVIELLREGPRRAGELAEAAELSAPAMSRHLRILKAAELVEEYHPAFDARVRIYSLKPAPIAALKNWLAETEALWASQLPDVMRHLEKSRG
jgi:DNA-binding transcriptional ArsR family regulator